MTRFHITRFRFHWPYFLFSILLLGAEIFIGARMHDRIIRPYVGDYLVVVWLYCLVRSFLDVPIVPTALAVLIFSYGVEITQYFHLADHLGFGAHSLGRILIGSSFEWTDLAMYTLGIVTVIIVEKSIRRDGKVFCSEGVDRAADLG